MYAFNLSLLPHCKEEFIDFGFKSVYGILNHSELIWLPFKPLSLGKEDLI